MVTILLAMGAEADGKQARPEDGVTDEMIARRAYEIAQSGHGGSEVENWFRAAEQLRAERERAAETLTSAAD